MQLTGEDGQRLLRRVIGIRFLLSLRTNAERKKNNQQANVSHSQTIAMLNGERGEVPTAVERLASYGARLSTGGYFCVGA